MWQMVRFGMKISKKIWLMITVLVCAVCMFRTDDTFAKSSQDETVKILLVGNSLTKYGPHEDGRTVQGHLEKMAQAAGKQVEIRSLTCGGALLKYWAGMAEQDKNYKQEFSETLGGEEWDYVVLQEYSKTPYLNYERDTIPAVRRLLKTIQKTVPEAKIFLYMPHGYDWRNLSGEEMTVYTGAAHARLHAQFEVDVIPVGKQFYRSSVLYPKIKLLGKDQRHPSKKGYFLAASCIYYEIFGEKPRLNKEVRKHAGITKKQGKKLLSLVGEEIQSTKVTKTLAKGATYKMKTDAVDEVHFYSLHPEVAQVDEKTGVVTALTAGQAIIVAETKDGRQTYCTVFSDYPKVQNIKTEIVSMNDAKSKASVRLTWDKTEGALYHVYRSSSANGNYKLLAEVKRNRYTDKKVKTGRTWYYKIITVDPVSRCEHRSSKRIKVKIDG